jgi:hypothetical protein
MELLATLFVGKPQNMLAVAGVFLAGYLMLRFAASGPSHHPRLLLIASAAWGLYAACEWIVNVGTPEANIRVDLLVAWPALAIISG